MEFTAQQIAAFLNGTVEGDPEAKVNNLAKIEEGAPGTMTFLANPAYTHFIYSTGATIVVVRRDFTAAHPVAATLIRVDSPYDAFATLLEMYDQMKTRKTGISAQAFIAKTASIGENAYIGEFAWIGENVKIGKNAQIHPQVYIGENVTIGDDCLLYPGVKIYQGCVIGHSCTLHGGVVIGSDGFGFAPQDDKNYRKVPQVGNVILEDHVEVGSNTTIDRATLGSTIIRRGVKLDNLIQVAHNVEIGENTVIAAQSGISGSTRIGKNCMIGGQVGFVGHLTIGDNAKIGARSGVEGTVKPDAVIFGAPAIDAPKARRNFIHWRNLDDIVKKIYQLEKDFKNQKKDHE
jgi:UDP-3-O-[3-hydroxymyristoyl] glucosamine N-acyltransferase